MHGIVIIDTEQVAAGLQLGQVNEEERLEEAPAGAQQQHHDHEDVDVDQPDQFGYARHQLGGLGVLLDADVQLAHEYDHHDEHPVGQIEGDRVVRVTFSSDGPVEYYSSQNGLIGKFSLIKIHFECNFLK